MTDILKLDLTFLVKKAITQKFMLELAEELKERIRKRTRLGYGVSALGANQNPLEKLADSTIRKRKNLNRRGKLSGDTKPNKSNLTESGQLLDSLEVRANGTTVEIFVSGTRNQTIFSYNVGTRPFLNPTRQDLKALANLIETEIRKQF
jgi:hypothetical protein